jgi:hypothetical protein
MNKWLLLFFLGLINLNGFSQKNFEGEITYKIISQFNNENESTIKALIKGKKLLISNQYKVGDPIVYTLYDFEKGKIFNLSLSDSIVICTNLTGSFFNEIIDSSNYDKLILNNNCTKYSYKIAPPMSNYLLNFDAYFSNKINFEVPLNMCGIIPPNILLNGKSISLRTVGKTKGNTKLNIPVVDVEFIADTIKEVALDNSLFEIPDFLKSMTHLEYSEFLLSKFNKIDTELGFPIKDKKKFIKKVNKELKKQGVPSIPKKTKFLKPSK